MNKMKKRKRKVSIEKEYEPYKHLSYDSSELIASFINSNKFTKKKLVKLIQQYNEVKNMKKKKKKVKFIIDMVPKGTPRPRINMFTKSIYVEGAKKNWEFFNKLVNTGVINLDGKIYTSTEMDIKFFLPIPNGMTINEKILAEKGVIRPGLKPDWDNLGKTTDMFNNIVWIDDSLVVDARVRKYYSFKPRVEVKIKYERDFDSNYNKKRITNSKGYKELFKDSKPLFKK